MFPNFSFKILCIVSGLTLYKIPNFLQLVFSFRYLNIISKTCFSVNFEKALLVPFLGICKKLSKECFIL